MLKSVSVIESFFRKKLSKAPIYSNTGDVMSIGLMFQGC